MFTKQGNASQVLLQCQGKVTGYLTTSKVVILQPYNQNFSLVLPRLDSVVTSWVGYSLWILCQYFCAQ